MTDPTGPNENTRAFVVEIDGLREVNAKACDLAIRYVDGRRRIALTEPFYGIVRDEMPDHIQAHVIVPGSEIYSHLFVFLHTNFRKMWDRDPTALGAALDVILGR